LWATLRVTHEIHSRSRNEFRNIAASTVAIKEPEQIDISQPILGVAIRARKRSAFVTARRSPGVEDEILRIASKKGRN
jgi:hypothetical protein